MKNNQIKLTEIIQVKKDVVNQKTILSKWLRMKNGMVKKSEVQNENNKTLKGIPKGQKRNSGKEIIFK